MKFNVTCFLTVLSLVVFFRVSSQVKPATADEATTVLQRVSAKLNSINTVSYHFYRDVNYKSEGIHNEMSGPTFLDFKSSDTIAGFKFQLESDIYKMVYDGATFFSADKKTKIMNVKKQPTIGDFLSLSFFYNSILTLRRAIPAVLADRDVVKTIADTVINKTYYHLVSFTFDSKVLGNLGQIKTLTSKRNITYQLIIDKTTYLPTDVIQTNSITPQDYVLTRFSNYKINSDIPAENTWHYFNYIDVYKPIIKNQ